MIYVTRKAHFSASHRLFNPSFSDEKNLLVYDKCANPNGHGHNYYIEVTIAGEPDPDTGYVIDLKKLKQIILSARWTTNISISMCSFSKELFQRRRILRSHAGTKSPLIFGKESFIPYDCLKRRIIP